MMFGVMALAVVVFVAVVFFWMWCFPNGTSASGEARNSYTVRLMEGFYGDTVCVALNDSVVFNGMVDREPLYIEVTVSSKENLLMVSRKKTGLMASFELPESGGMVMLHGDGDRTEMRMEN